MNAQDAKKQAEANKAQIAENVKIRIDKAKLDNVESLMLHFRIQIGEAVKKGLMTTAEISFPVDRFTDEVIREVSDQLKADGYNLSMNKHNAFQTVGFTINWAN